MNTSTIRTALEAVQDYLQRIANDERVTGWVHSQDYGLYLLLADPDCGPELKAALLELDRGRPVPLVDIHKLDFMSHYNNQPNDAEDPFDAGALTAAGVITDIYEPHLAQQEATIEQLRARVGELEAVGDNMEKVCWDFFDNGLLRNGSGWFPDTHQIQHFCEAITGWQKARSLLNTSEQP